MLQACLHNVEEALVSCRKIGYPIMLKASWGGWRQGHPEGVALSLTCLAVVMHQMLMSSCIHHGLSGPPAIACHLCAPPGMS